MTAGVRSRVVLFLWGLSASACGGQVKDGGPQSDWGGGFLPRLVDAGDPDHPSSPAQACAMFGGPLYHYNSVPDLVNHLTRRWLLCSESVYVGGEDFPLGFAGLDFHADGSWAVLEKAQGGGLQVMAGDRAHGPSYSIGALNGQSVPAAPDGAGEYFDLSFFDSKLLIVSNMFDGSLEERPTRLFFYPWNEYLFVPADP